MSSRFAIAGFAVALATVAAPASSQTLGCAGILTIERLGDPACIRRIQAPTARPDSAAAGTGKQDRVRSLVYIDAQTQDGVRHIRLVGPRYLPNMASRIDLRRPVTFSSDPLNAAVFSVASLFVREGGDKARPTDTSGQATPVLEASAAPAQHVASN